MKQLNWYQIFGKSNIPDGRTVLPTDDIQIWLNCANIWNKTYTTLGEVLADTDTLLALINSSNAVDYMVRSTTWAAGASIPTMTSNTTPSGVVLEGQSMQSGSEGYKLFDGFTNTQPYKASAATSAWIGYDFGSAVTINTMSVYSGGSGRPCTLGYSDNGVNWTDYETALTTVSNAWVDQSVSIGSPHRFWRCKVVLDTAVAGFGINEVRIYSLSITNNATAMTLIGANNYCANTLLADSTWCNAICNSEYFESVLNVKIPKMTSDTTPSGKAFGDSIETSYPAYKAMDGNDTSYALSLGNATNPTFGYTFTANRSIYLAVLLVSSSANSSVTYTCKLQGSNDEFINDVHDITEAFTYSASINDKITVKKVCTLLSGCSSYRAINTARTSSAARFMAYSIQFYGREDV